MYDNLCWMSLQSESYFRQQIKWTKYDELHKSFDTLITKKVHYKTPNAKQKQKNSPTFTSFNILGVT